MICYQTILESGHEAVICVSERWLKSMHIPETRKILGEESKDFTDDDLIEDFMAVHWAWETVL